MILWFVSLLALVVLLFALAVAGQVLLATGRAGLVPWRRERGTRPVSATRFEVLHAGPAPGKAQELKERQNSLPLREDETAAGPGSGTVDLDSGRIMVRRAEGQSGADRRAARVFRAVPSLGVRVL